MARAATDESDGRMIEGHVSEELGAWVMDMLYTIMARLCTTVLGEYFVERPFIAQAVNTPIDAATNPFQNLGGC